MVKIYPERIVGELQHTMSDYINLSSCPREVLSLMIARIPKAPDTIRYVQLIPNMMYNARKGEFNKHSKRRSAIFIHDDDDNMIDIKIKNIKQYIGIRMADRIIMCRETKSRKDQTRPGTTKTFCNPQHTDEMSKTLAIYDNNIINPSSIAMALIIQTTGCYLSSVSGMVLAIEYYKIPYQIEKRHTILEPSWLCIKSETFNDKYELANITMNTTDQPKTKRKWQNMQGYTNYVTTERGPKKIIVKKEKKGNNWLLALLWQIIMVIINMIVTGLEVLRRKPSSREEQKTAKKGKDTKKKQSGNK